jgi:hypothetical protein
MRDIHHRPRLIGVGPDQQRHIVLLARSERLVGRSGQDPGFNHRVDDAAAVAREQ